MVVRGTGRLWGWSGFVTGGCAWTLPIYGSGRRYPQSSLSLVLLCYFSKEKSRDSERALSIAPLGRGGLKTQLSTQGSHIVKSVWFGVHSTHRKRSVAVYSVPVFHSFSAAFCFPSFRSLIRPLQGTYCNCCCQLYSSLIVGPFFPSIWNPPASIWIELSVLEGYIYMLFLHLPPQLYKGKCIKVSGSLKFCEPGLGLGFFLGLHKSTFQTARARWGLGFVANEVEEWMGNHSLSSMATGSH